MRKHFAILSLFDGISCGQIALNKVLPPYSLYTYYSCEIDGNAIDITHHNYPQTIQLGDVRELRRNMIPYDIFLIMGGSPCQCFSFAGRQKGMTTKQNIEIRSLEQYLKYKRSGFEFEGQSYLYWEFVRIVEEFKPQYFLLENVLMNTKWADIISKGLGVEPIRINSSLVSAQNRDRLYWTNIPNVKPPEDKQIYLHNKIPGARGCGYRGVWNTNLNIYVSNFTIRKDSKANCVVTTNGPTNMIIFEDGEARHLTISEIEMLQTLPKGYTNLATITKSARHKAIGNGWTVDVITHILSHIPEMKK